MRCVLNIQGERASLLSMRRISLILAGASLVWERAVPLVWPVLAWLFLYAGITLLGAWDAVGDPWRALFALVSLTGFAVLTWRAARQFAWPDLSDIAHRLERDSGMAGRPYEAVTDQAAPLSAAEHALWDEHQRRERERLAALKARRPHAAWARLDPWALRIVLLLFVLSAWVLAGPQARSRLDDAFAFRPINALSQNLRIEAWIDPPAYTGRAPQFLDADAFEIEVPEGAQFVTRIAGSRRTPRLTLNQGTDRVRTDAVEIGDGVWEIRQLIERDTELTLRAGGTRTQWSVDIIPDTAPLVRLLEAPASTAQGELELRFEVIDDYGATDYALEIRPEGATDTDWDSLVLPGEQVRSAPEGNGMIGTVETARHQWAGDRVEMRLAVRDAADNTGYSGVQTRVLPERVFLDSLARAVAEQRREVMRHAGPYAPLIEPEPLYADDLPPGPLYLYDTPGRRIERAPDGIQRVAVALTALTDAPEYFFDDGTVLLGLRVVLHRLQRARHWDDAGPVAADLWAIALRAELGSLADAEAALAAAERALQEALARGADETELDALFQAYQQAMDNYLAALAREAEQGNAQAGGDVPMMDPADFEELLAALREAAELGDTAQAREALDMLSELLRNLEMQMGQGSGDGEPSDEISEALSEALEELGDVIGEQRELQDQTFGMQQENGGQPQGGQGQGGQSQGGPQNSGNTPGQQGGNTPQGLAENQQGGTSRSAQLAERQAAIAGQLERAREGLPGGSADPLAGAGDAMQQAEEALRQGNLDDALEAQDDALSELRDGAESLARDLLERMAENEGGPGEGDQEQDPLGRPTNGAYSDGAGVDVPEEMSRARAREILEELRRRAAETGRPQDELDYIDRLLDRF